MAMILKMTEDDSEGKSKSIALKNLPTFHENPFVDEFGHVAKRKKTEVFYDGKKAMVNLETGAVDEDTEAIALAKVKWVETDQFVKMYASSLMVWFELKSAAQKVAEFLLHQMSTRAMNRGEVVLTFYDYKEYFKGRTGCSQATYTRGLQELAQKNIVAKSKARDLWYINPALAFNGDRARFITEFRRKKKSRAEELEEEGQQRLFSEPKKDPESEGEAASGTSDA